MVILEMQKVSGGKADTQEHLGEPPARKLRQDHASSSLDSVFDDCRWASISINVQCTSGGCHSVRDLPWRDHNFSGRTHCGTEGLTKCGFPLLLKRYLSAPCSSVESECLFSSVSHIIDENWNRLTADNAEKLLFNKKNLPLTFPKKA